MPDDYKTLAASSHASAAAIYATGRCCEREHEAGQITANLFADFNGIPKGADKTEFYQHDQNWSNRMVLLGDSLPQKEGLAAQVRSDIRSGT